MNKLPVVALLILGNSVWGQSSKDSLKSEQERDITFTLAEVMPTYKKGPKEFESFLAKEIDASVVEETEEGVYTFVVSKNGDVSKFQKVKGALSIEEELKKAILKSSGDWNPALQNNYKVNAYCRIKVYIRSKTIHADIFRQGK